MCHVGGLSAEGSSPVSIGVGGARREKVLTEEPLDQEITAPRAGQRLLKPPN